MWPYPGNAGHYNKTITSHVTSWRTEAYGKHYCGPPISVHIPIAPPQQLPSVTILACTRDRGESVAATIRSILACTYPDFTLLIVDQSSDTRTERAIAAFRRDSRLRYIHTSIGGKSRAENVALSFINTDIVLLTDDDCEVPPNWITEMVTPFLRYPQVGIVFCDVIAAPHDTSAGWIPVSLSTRALLVEDLAHWQTCDGVNIGIGAGMAVRRSAAEAIGGFDPLFGPGSRFFNGDDLDFTLCALIAGHQIYRVNHVGVVHHGFRTMIENRTLMRQAMFSLGGVYGRLIRGGQWRAALNLVAIVNATLGVPIRESLMRLRVPPVLGRATWLARGMIAGLRLPEPELPGS